MPKITSLVYNSEYAFLPPGNGMAGVTLTTDTGPAGNILAFRLRLASTNTVIGYSSLTVMVGLTTATFQPSFPLSATESYMIDYLPVAPPFPTDGSKIIWTNAESAPVIATTVIIRDAEFTGTELVVKLDYGVSGIALGAKVAVYDPRSLLGSATAQGDIIRVPVSKTAFLTTYLIVAQAAIPATNTLGAGAFAKPFSLGTAAMASIAVPVTSVLLDQPNHHITATVPMSTGLTVNAYLVAGGKRLAGPVAPVQQPGSATMGTVTFPATGTNYDAPGMIGLGVIASAVTLNEDGLVTSASLPTDPAILLATQPVLESAMISTVAGDNTKWQIDCKWLRLPDTPENVSSYTVEIREGTATKLTSKTVPGTNTTIILNNASIDFTKPHYIWLYGNGKTGGSSPIQSTPLFFAGSLLTTLTTTNEGLDVSWAVPVAPPAPITLPPLSYRVVIRNGKDVIYRGPVVTGTNASAPLAGLIEYNAATLSVMVDVTAGPVTLVADSSMDPKISANPLLNPPLILPVSAATGTNVTTINWVAPKGPVPNTYSILFSDGAQGSSTGTSLPLTQVLKPGQQLGYSLQAKSIQNTIIVFGPLSPPEILPSVTAVMVKVCFDGANATVTWKAVPGAHSYNVFLVTSLLPQGFTYTLKLSTANTSAVFLVDSANDGCFVSVQPVTARGVGISSPPTALFTPGFFVSSQPAASFYPYVYRANRFSEFSTGVAVPASPPIVLYFPELGTQAGALGTAAIESVPACFKMEPSGLQNLPYKLTISVLAWTFNPDPIRAVLQAAYTNFLQRLEKPPTSGPALKGASPYGISLVQSAIAAALPQTFSEQLFYYFGLSPKTSAAAGYIDLRPGMILRIVSGSYLSIARDELSNWINGYGGASVTDLEISSYHSSGAWQSGFDSFLNTLSALGTLSVYTPDIGSNKVQKGLASAVDLYFPQFIKPFYRLYFPASVPEPTGPGSSNTEFNFTLVAASSYTTLQDTTIDPGHNPTAYFRGRAVIEIMIKVLVNGHERVIPAGTSLGNLLDQYGLRPVTLSRLSRDIRVFRNVAAAATQADPATGAPSRLEIRLDWTGTGSYGLGNGFDALSLPLLPGDSILTENQPDA